MHSVENSLSNDWKKSVSLGDTVLPGPPGATQGPPDESRGNVSFPSWPTPPFVPVGTHLPPLPVCGNAATGDGI